MLTIKVIGSQLHFLNSYAIKDFLKNLGFRFNSELKSWYKSIRNKDILSDIHKIKLYILQTFNDQELCKDLIERLDLITQQITSNKLALLLLDNTLKLSDIIKDTIFIDGDYLSKMKFIDISNIEIPVGNKNLQYKNYQKEFVKFALDKKYILLADEMGLGKTVQAIALINYLNLSKVFVITPAFLKLNWLNELKHWLANKALHIQIIDTKNLKRFTDFQKGIYIVNYELCEKIYEKFYNNDSFNSLKFDLIVYDESHYIKNINAKRTYYSLKFNADRYLFMTGTPILNNLLDIVPLLLKILYPTIYSLDYNEYIKQARLFQQYILEKYCYYVETNYGIKVLGTKNIEEAKAILKPFMIRRLKKDVLKELPDKIRNVIYLQSNKVKDLLKLEKNLFNVLYFGSRSSNNNNGKELNNLEEDMDLQTADYQDIGNLNVDLKTKIKILEDRLLEIIQNGESLNNKDYTNISTFALLRHLIGLYKIEDGIDYIMNTINNLENNRLVIFTYFNDTAEYLARELRRHNIKTLLVTGKLKPKQRFEAVKIFQSNKNDLMVFVGTIKSCGVGLNLTKASNLIFIELSLVPAEILQAEDRLHRIGQKRNIQVDYLIYEDSLDEIIYRYINKKQKNISEIISY